MLASWSTLKTRSVPWKRKALSPAVSRHRVENSQRARQGVRPAWAWWALSLWRSQPPEGHRHRSDHHAPHRFDEGIVGGPAREQPVSRAPITWGRAPEEPTFELKMSRPVGKVAEGGRALAPLQQEEPGVFRELRGGRQAGRTRTHGRPRWDEGARPAGGTRAHGQAEPERLAGARSGLFRLRKVLIFILRALEATEGLQAVV